MPGQTPTRKRTVVVFSGAGLSAESGIPTFRDSNGLWESHRVEDVASPGGCRLRQISDHNVVMVNDPCLSNIHGLVGIWTVKPPCHIPEFLRSRPVDVGT